MKFSYNWLQSFFEKKLPKPDELAEVLTMHSFEVEEVEKKGKDYILDIDILPNRAHDCLSHLGVARECAALLKSNIKYQISKTQIKNQKGPLQIKADKALCPRYSAYVVEGIKITESPQWVKERLASMDQKPINNVVDITNYIMWELGQPLHAFDFDKIKGAKMNIRLSKKGEKLETLDGAKYDLGSETIIIEDGDLPAGEAGRIIDLAGIKGGANTQVDDTTTTIIFQAAIFEPSRIRRTSQKLGIRTDAAVRYMHGFDTRLPPQALGRAMVLLAETNPKVKIVQKIDIHKNNAKLKKVAVETRYVNSLLGTDVSKKMMQQTLERLGFGLPSLARGFTMKDLGGKFTVTVPSYRLDVNIQEDIVEEIGRVYGYENITQDSPRGVLITPRRNEQVFWRAKARDILSSFGFSEVYNYSLISGDEALEVANPVSDEFRYLRPSLWQGILRNIAANEKNFSTMQIFEIGKVFLKSGEDVSENENCIFALSLPSEGKRGEGFYRAKGYADEFFKKLGVTDFYYDPAFNDEEEERFSFLHNTRRANIIVDNKKCGFLGEIHPKTREAYDVGEGVYFAEIDFGWVQSVAEKEHIYQKPSKYPEVVRDIALLVPRGTMVVEALNAINGVSGPLLRDIDLFDMFEGENLPDGMKNLAFHLIFQSDEKTLTSHEVDEIMAKITKTLQEKLWEVR